MKINTLLLLAVFLCRPWQPVLAKYSLLRLARIFGNQCVTKVASTPMIVGQHVRDFMSRRSASSVSERRNLARTSFTLPFDASATRSLTTCVCPGTRKRDTVEAGNAPNARLITYPLVAKATSFPIHHAMPSSMAIAIGSVALGDAKTIALVYMLPFAVKETLNTTVHAPRDVPVLRNAFVEYVNTNSAQDFTIRSVAMAKTFVTSAGPNWEDLRVGNARKVPATLSLIIRRRI